MKIFLITGEASGDLIGSKLINELKKNFNNLEVRGVGGNNLIELGLISIFDQTDIAVNGFIEIIPHIPKILKRINQTVDEIIKYQPDIIITIDSPDFNFRVIKKLRKQKPDITSKIIHYVAPTVWAYREKRAAKIAKLYDLLLVILPFEPPFFEKYGLKTVFIGHPIFTNFKPKEIQTKTNKVIITPGSRKSEIQRFAPIIKELVYQIKSNFGAKFELYLFITKETKNLIYELYHDQLNKSFLQIVFKQTEKDSIINECFLAILKSGTNTMEIANKSIPMIIYYKFNFLTYHLLKKVFKVKTKFANLLNYHADREIIPEYLHSKCKADLIYQEFRNYFYHSEKRQQQVDAYNKVISSFKNLDNISPEQKAALEITKILNSTN